MTLTRRSLLGVALLLPVAGTILRPALAQEPEVFAPGGLAISGYDPVAYFTEGHAVQGSANHALRWRGAMWYFVSARNMEDFEMNPAAYAPRYGGYCAYALAGGSIEPSSPEAFTIYKGRLYLANGDAARAIWRQDPDGNILKADANWPAILEK